MLDLTKKVMPSAVEVDGIFYPIKTDFKYWLAFGRSLSNPPIKPEEFLSLFTKDFPVNIQGAFEKLFEFYQPKRELPRVVGAQSSDIVFSYEYDSDLVYSAFMQQYHIDLIDCEMHWHKFIALFDGLKDTKLNEVIGFRSYTTGNKKTYEQQQKELKRAWELPQKESAEEKEALDKFNSLFE